MGNVNQLLTISTPSSTPKQLSFNECRQMIADTNHCLDQNKSQLGLSLHIFTSSFTYFQQNWGLSKATCQVSNFGTTMGQVPQLLEITMQMAQIFKIYQLIKHFRKTGKSVPKQICSNLKRGTLYKTRPKSKKIAAYVLTKRQQPSFPAAYLSLTQHCYCPLCTSMYIIDQEDHRCPQCRRSFHGNKKALKKTFYEVIQEDRILYQQARSQIIQHISVHNAEAVRLLQQQKTKKFQSEN